MVIRQGDVFWVDLGEPRGAAPGYRLRKGEANLSKRSAVNVSQIFTVDKADLVEKIGTLACA
ncbi:MAG: hypothetical protein KAW49_09150 [Anaerolineae bacterium]|nr:hypothetical protein [Anaerolineae bacterium]